MKHLAYIIILFIPMVSIGQTFSFQPSDTLEKYYDYDEFAADYIDVQNDGAENITLNFEIVSNTIQDKGWYLSMCTNRYCYPSVPKSGSLGSIAPGKSGSGYISPQIGFNKIEGKAEMIVRIFEAGNPANADTMVFIFHASRSSGISIVNNADFSVHPNPTSSSISISQGQIQEASSATIYNSVGQVVLLATQNFALKPAIDVSTLDNGIYSIVLSNKDGSLRRTSFMKN